MARVVIKGLNKKYSETVAVKNLDLDVKDGSFVVLLGPSGCGKTTTLRCVAGLETFDEGDIYIGDKLVNDLPPKERDVALVFQSYALYPNMSVYDNMAFPLKMRKTPKDDIKRRVEETADLLKIRHLLNRKPKQLSGGEAQRAALGRAIVRHPQVFLMDEPLSNLDAKLRIHMRTELKRLHKDLGVTTIYVTHDQIEAMTMSDEVAIMDQGELQQFGDVFSIFHHPSNTFVAGFIGSPPMNFIEGSLIEKDGTFTLDSGNFKVLLDQSIKSHLEKAGGSEFVLGARPEDVILSKTRDKDSLLKTEIYTVEPLGSENIVSIVMGDNLIRARTTLDFSVSPGDLVWMAINTKRMHLFDKKSGKAIF